MSTPFKPAALLTLVLLASGTTFAQEISPEPAAPQAASRAEVRAELERARASGDMPATGPFYARQDLSVHASGNTRAAVRAELAQARAQGKLRSSEVHDDLDFALGAGARSRAEVEAEVRDALARGERLSQGNG